MISKRAICLLSSACMVAVASAANPVLVDSAGSGNFTTIQGAISSWCAGGVNSLETAPFVINIKAGSGPYDEAVHLEATSVGLGDIVGDIVIQSETTATKAVLKLQKATISTLTGPLDDALIIAQNTHNVTFKDIIFTRSIASSATFATDELINMNEHSANAVINSVKFHRCVFTEPGPSGAPMVTDKASALATVPSQALRGTGIGGSASAYTTASATLTTTALTGDARLLQQLGPVGGSRSLELDNCVLYASTNVGCVVRLDGTTGVGTGYDERTTITNTLCCYSGADGFNLGGQNQKAEYNITGTDQKAGPLNCTASLQSSLHGNAFGHPFTFNQSGNAANVDSLIFNVSKVIAFNSAPLSFSSARGISGSQGQLNFSDVIIASQNIGVVGYVRLPTVWNRVTIHTFGSFNGMFHATSGEGSLTLNDCVVSGAGTKFGGAPAGGNIVNNSCLPTSGPYAITATGTITQSNNISADPQYVSLDGFSADFMDVPNIAFQTAGTGGAALAGGANYTGPPPVTNAENWSLYY